VSDFVGLILSIVFLITLLGFRANIGKPVNFLFMGDYVCKPYVERGPQGE
jgi:hypothetical protein